MSTADACSTTDAAAAAFAEGGSGGADGGSKRSKSDDGAADGDGPLLLESVVKVDSANPVQSFCQMLIDGTLAQAEMACKQMGEIVVLLLGQAGDAPDAPVAEKGFRCLRELRCGAVREDLPAPFNETLRKLRDLYGDGGAAGAMWARLFEECGKAGGGLITADEVPGESDVSEEAVRAFWTASSAEMPLPPAPPPATSAANDDGDLDLDLLE